MIIHGNDDVSLSSLFATVQEKLRETPQYSQTRCIYKVPNMLRETNEQSFTPLIVSIGPLHRNNEKLRPMESHKLKYLHSFLGEPQADADLLKLCLKIIKNWGPTICESYADPIKLSREEFTQMVLIDSVFIIMFFSILDGSQAHGDDYVFNSPFLRNSVLRDLQLEENQLPLFIIDKLYCAKFPTGESSSIHPTASFMNIVCKGLSIEPCVYNAIVNGTYICQHLLHLVALDGQPPVSTPIPDGDEATQLHEAGVKFQVNKDSSSLLDIKFDDVKGILKIPELLVDDDTEFLARNLIAFEQCHYSNDDIHYFTDYYFFLNWLINTTEDVQLLANAGIIKNLMGSPQQVSDLINSLDTGAVTAYKRYCYGKISLDLQSHCKKRWNKHRATLMHNYFNHPWASISVGYAIVLLVLTVLQVWLGFKAMPK